MHLADNRVVEQIPWSQLGAKETAITMISGAEPGGIWLGFRLGRGVVYVRDGKVQQSYRAADGLGAGAVYGLKLDRDGAVWAATASGLSLIRNGRVTTFTSNNGLPCNTVHLVMDGNDASTWLYTGCGLVRLEKAELEAWKTDATRAVHPTLFDNSDGVSIRSSVEGGYGPRITLSPDGRLWFVPGNGGVSVIDPRHLAVNKLPPPVHIEHIIADVNPGLSPACACPPTSTPCEIDFTALSLVAPEKIHFRYKLEGQNSDWHDVVNRRQVLYTNLAPAQVPLPRHRLQQQRRVERNRRHAGVLHRSGVQSDLVVLRVVRGRLSGHALGAIPAARCIRSRGSSTRSWTGAWTSGCASRGSCTIRCCRAFRLR